MNVTSLFFVWSSFFSVERGHISLLPLAILFMTQCFVLPRVLLPLSFSSHVSILDLVCVMVGPRRVGPRGGARKGGAPKGGPGVRGEGGPGEREQKC